VKPDFAVVVIGGERFEASGGLVTPEDPYTMELGGSGNLGFDSHALIPLGDRSIRSTVEPEPLAGRP